MTTTLRCICKANANGFVTFCPEMCSVLQFNVVSTHRSAISTANLPSPAAGGGWVLSRIQDDSSCRGVRKRRAGPGDQDHFTNRARMNNRAPLKIDRFPANCVSGLGAHVIDQEYLALRRKIKMPIRLQPGFFDIHERTAKLTEMGDPLVGLNEQIDWEAFRPG